MQIDEWSLQPVFASAKPGTLVSEFDLPNIDNGMTGWRMVLQVRCEGEIKRQSLGRVCPDSAPQ